MERQQRRASLSPEDAVLAHASETVRRLGASLRARAGWMTKERIDQVLASKNPVEALVTSAEYYMTEDAARFRTLNMVVAVLSKKPAVTSASAPPDPWNEILNRVMARDERDGSPTPPWSGARAGAGKISYYVNVSSLRLLVKPSDWANRFGSWNTKPWPEELPEFAAAHAPRTRPDLDLYTARLYEILRRAHAEIKKLSKKDDAIYRQYQSAIAGEKLPEDGAMRCGKIAAMATYPPEAAMRALSRKADEDMRSDSACHIKFNLGLGDTLDADVDPASLLGSVTELTVVMKAMLDAKMPVIIPEAIAQRFVDASTSAISANGAWRRLGEPDKNVKEVMDKFRDVHETGFMCWWVTQTIRRLTTIVECVNHLIHSTPSARIEGEGEGGEGGGEGAVMMQVIE